MRYKVTPTIPGSAEKKRQRQPLQPGEKRKRRASAVYDADGNEVLITLKCLKCDQMRPLSMFGLRRMADGAIRNQPWCRKCRSLERPPEDKEAHEASELATADGGNGAEPDATALPASEVASPTSKAPEAAGEEATSPHDPASAS